MFNSKFFQAKKVIEAAKKEFQNYMKFMANSEHHHGAGGAAVTAFKAYEKFKAENKKNNAEEQVEDSEKNSWKF